MLYSRCWVFLSFIFFSFFELVNNNETNWLTSTIFLFTTASPTSRWRLNIKPRRLEELSTNRQRWIFFSPKIMFKQFFSATPEISGQLFLINLPACIYFIQDFYCPFNDTGYLRIGMFSINKRIKLQLIFFVTPMVWRL